MTNKYYEDFLEKKKNLNEKVEIPIVRIGISVLTSLALVILAIILQISGKKQFYFEMKYAELDEDITNKLRSIVNDNDVNVYKIHSSEVNAFTYEGPNFYYFVGLEKKLDLTKRELIAVMLHEYGHYAEGHTNKKTNAKYYSEIFILWSFLFFSQHIHHIFLSFF